MSLAESAKEMNALMDAHVTEEEWEAQRKRNKLLHDCKTKGFKRLALLGQFKGGIKLSEERAAPIFSPLEFATQAAQMVNDGMTITKATAKFGRNPGDLRHYCNKFGIEYCSKLAKRTWDYDKTYTRARRLINEQGYRLKNAADKMDCSPRLILNILKSKGRRYNAKTIKIERIEK